MFLSLASPVYNESTNIQEFIRRSHKTLKGLTDHFEIVLVNDASPDDTLQKIKDVIPLYPEIRLINLTQNSGQHISSSIALKESKGDWVFLMDSDLQVQPEYMKEFFNHLKKVPDCEILSAQRLTRSKGFLRRQGSRFVSRLTQVMNKTKLKDPGSSFKLFSRKALNLMLENNILIQNYPILMLNLNLKIYELPIVYNTESVRNSNYGFVDLVGVIILALLNFSTGRLTLVLLIILGMISGFVGTTGFLVSVIIGMIHTSPLPTNLLILFLVLIVIGIQFVLMGMIVFKLERININLNFRRSLDQRVSYEN